MFDKTCVFMIFPTYVSSCFGSNRDIYFSLRKTFDPRRGFRHPYILPSLTTVATRGHARGAGPTKHMLADATGRPKVVFDVPKVM